MHGAHAVKDDTFSFVSNILNRHKHVSKSFNVTKCERSRRYQCWSSACRRLLVCSNDAVHYRGYISGFPNTYAEKVGKTSDAMYKGDCALHQAAFGVACNPVWLTACFSAYMSMHCSSIFPRCTMPQSRSEPIPAGGRVPMCLHLVRDFWLLCLEHQHSHSVRFQCILPLVLCPGTLLWACS